ncbi:hypothetical protein HDU85_000004 [Gaertneriomyces sp. JEL0708]|nr:hypothetical protein HDU85_000004 [Gaertneriomyces sp. JEL0708]
MDIKHVLLCTSVLLCIGAIPTVTSSTSNATNCVSEWFGTVPVEGGPDSSQGVAFFYPIHQFGCTGRYNFSYTTFPPDQASVVSFVDGRHESAIAELAPGTIGSTTLILNFGLNPSEPGAPWFVAMLAWPERYARWDSPVQEKLPATSLHYTFRLEGVLEPIRGPPVSEFFNRDVGSVKMSTIIGATGGSVVLGATMIGGFIWRRKVKRRTVRRVTVTVEQGKRRWEDESGCEQADMAGSAESIPASSSTRPGSPHHDDATPSTCPDVVREAGTEDADAGTNVDLDSRFAAFVRSTMYPVSRDDVDVGEGVADIETIRLLVQASKQRQAALTRQLRQEQAAMYELIFGYLTEKKQEQRGMTSRWPQVNVERSHNESVAPEQPLEPSIPDPDAIEVLENTQTERKQEQRGMTSRWPQVKVERSRNESVAREQPLDPPIPDPDAIEVLENVQ